MSFYSWKFNRLCKKSDDKRDEGLTIPSNVQVYKDIPYSENKKCLLDVNIPKDFDENKNIPVIINIHGGGFVYGTKETYKFYVADLCKRGFAVVNFTYRLAPKYKFPAPLEDINAVVEWIVKNAKEYRFDLTNIFLIGDSAGAQLASQYGAIATNESYEKEFEFKVPRDITIRAMALNCGLYSFHERPIDFKDYLGKNWDETDKRLKVLDNISANYPPCYVMSAAHDFLKEKAEPMCKFIQSKGVEAKMKIYGEEKDEHMLHVFHCNLKLKEADECNGDECEFFKEYIR